MIYNALRRLIRQRCHTAVALAIMPLAILNGLPLAEGCICADGHYEPLCRAQLHNTVCPVHAKRSCCEAHPCCVETHRRHISPEKSDHRQALGGRCCTPLLHQALPIISVATHVPFDNHIAVSHAALIEPAHFLSPEMMHRGYPVEVDTG